MSFEPDNIAEVFPRGLRIEQKIAWLGCVVLAASAPIETISPIDAEYTAIAGGGMLAAGIATAAIDTYRRRNMRESDPDDPDEPEEGIEFNGEVIEFPQPKVLPLPEEKAA